MTPLETARAACATRRWCDAFDHFSEAADAAPLEAPDLVLYATAAILLGRDAEGVDLQTRAHEAFLKRGDVLAAGRIAAWIAVFLGGLGEFSRSGGWVARANRLAAEAPTPNAISGLALVPQALGALYAGDAARSRELFEHVMSTGEQCGDREVTELGRLGLGQATVALGRTEEGMALLDEVMVAVTAGELAPMPAGIAYCAVIGVCWMASDLVREQEWTAALQTWCNEQPDMVVFSGQCQMHRAALFTLHGQWQDAIDAAEAAVERARLGDVNALYGGNYQRADVARARGQFAEADLYFSRAFATGWEPEPGLALLRLAQGKIESARTLITGAVDRAVEGEVHQYLPALIEIELAAGNTSAARRALDRLHEVSGASSMPFRQAVSRYSEAVVLLAEGESRAAYTSARAAISLWSRLSAPCEVARSRVIVGLACRALGDEASAIVEFDAARATFERLGAMPALGELNVVDARGAVDSGPLTPRELEVIRLVTVGRSNRAIAEELVLSEKTVARHLSNIFAKLGVTSRTAAAAFAHEHDLVAKRH